MWKEIEAKFNSNAELSQARTTKQLQDLWQNIRKKTKKDYAKHRRSSFITGGGPPASPLDALSETVVNIMGSSTMDPISDVPDDDEDVPITVVKSSSSSLRQTSKAVDVKQLQLTLLQEKIQQQRELHAAQMELIRTMKMTLERKTGTTIEQSESFLEMMNMS